MKTFRKILATALIIASSASVWAQSPANYTDATEVNTPNIASYIGTTPIDITRVDFVTTGSRAPYFIAPDASIFSLIGPLASDPFKNSVFQWSVLSNSATPATAPSNSTNGTLVTPNTVGTPLVSLDKTGAAYTAGLKFYAENWVAVDWLAGFTGTQYLGIAEQFVPKGGFACDPSDAQYAVKTVYVLPTPKFGFPAANTYTICKPVASTDVYIPIHLFGLGNFQVTGTVDYYPTLVGGVSVPSALTNYPVDGGPINLITDDIATSFATASGFYTALNIANNDLAGTPGSATKGIKITVPANTSGRYEVTITNVTDVVSRKSLVAISGGLSAAVAGDVSKYVVYVMPTPTKPVIQHLKNL